MSIYAMTSLDSYRVSLHFDWLCSLNKCVVTSYFFIKLAQNAIIFVHTYVLPSRSWFENV